MRKEISGLCAGDCGAGVARGRRGEEGDPDRWGRPGSGAESAGGPGARRRQARAEPGQAGGERAGPCGASGSGPKRGNKLGLGLLWAGIWGWLGFLGRVWFSIFLLFFFLNLIQTKFEFKFEFEFKPHSNKSMHQHECNNKNSNL